YVSAEGPKGLRLGDRCAECVILGTGFDLRVLDWARQRICEGIREAGRHDSGVALIGAGMLCVRDDGHRERRIVRNRIANRAHHNFRFTLETVPPEQLEGIRKFMAGFDVMKPMEDRVDPDLVNDYLVHRFSIAGTPAECIKRIGAPRRRGPTSHAHTGTQSLSRKRRDVCREGDTALQRLKYRNTVRSQNVRIRAAVELKTPKAAGVYARGLRLFPLISKDGI